MKPTQKLHEMGQSLWLDNITRGLLSSGTLRQYIQEFSVTGLTSNPTIFDHAIKNSHDYDDSIRQKLKEGKSGEALFFELAIEDLRTGRRSVSADPRPDEWSRRLGFIGGLAAAGSRRLGHPRRS
jgi:transaldolase